MEACRPRWRSETYAVASACFGLEKACVLRWGVSIAQGRRAAQRQAARNPVVFSNRERVECRERDLSIEICMI